MRINFPFWHFFDAETSTRESSYGQPRSLEPLYGIDFYFDEMISRGYSQIGVIHPYSYGKKYLLSVTNNPDSPTCNFFQNLPKTQGDTTSKIPWLLGRYTKDAIKKAGKTLIDGNNAACISVTISEHSSVEVIEEYEVKAFEILDVQLQYRATRRLVSVASNQILFESREVWSDGGWFAKYVLANPATGVSGRGYRYGNATMPFTIPSSPQTVNKG